MIVSDPESGGRNAFRLHAADYVPTHEIPIEETQKAKSQRYRSSEIRTQIGEATKTRSPVPLWTLADRIRNEEFGKQEIEEFHDRQFGAPIWFDVPRFYFDLTIQNRLAISCRQREVT